MARFKEMVTGRKVQGGSTLLDFPAESQEGSDTGEHDGYSLQETPQRSFEVPDVLEDHVMPFDEVRMVPDSPTAIKVLLTQLIPLRLYEVPDVLKVHEAPSGEVRIVPEKPTPTKVLFPYVTSLISLFVPDVLDVHEVPSVEVLMSLPLHLIQCLNSKTTLINFDNTIITSATCIIIPPPLCNTQR